MTFHRIPLTIKATPDTFLSCPDHEIALRFQTTPLYRSLQYISIRYWDRKTPALFTFDDNGNEYFSKVSRYPQAGIWKRLNIQEYTTLHAVTTPLRHQMHAVNIDLMMQL